MQRSSHSRLFRLSLASMTVREEQPQARTDAAAETGIDTLPVAP